MFNKNVTISKCLNGQNNTIKVLKMGQILLFKRKFRQNCLNFKILNVKIASGEVRTSVKNSLFTKLFQKLVTRASEVGFKKFKMLNYLIFYYKFNQNKTIAKRGRKNLIEKSNEVKMAQEY